MLAVDNAFSDRSSALLTVQTLSSELVSLNSRIEKLEAASSKIFGGDKSRMRKVEELKEAIRITENAKSCAEREYEQIKVASLFFFFPTQSICNSDFFLLTELFPHTYIVAYIRRNGFSVFCLTLDKSHTPIYAKILIFYFICPMFSFHNRRSNATIALLLIDFHIWFTFNLPMPFKEN